MDFRPAESASAEVESGSSWMIEAPATNKYLPNCCSWVEVWSIRSRRENRPVAIRGFQIQGMEDLSLSESNLLWVLNISMVEEEYQGEK